MNVKLLRKIQKHILAEPRRYNQSIWRMSAAEVAALGDEAPACKTVACIAGWACVIAGQPSRSNSVIEKRAARLIGLDRDQSDRLFYSAGPFGEWPGKFQNSYYAAKTAAGRARAAVRRIDHFIKTKGAE